MAKHASPAPAFTKQFLDVIEPAAGGKELTRDTRLVLDLGFDEIDTVELAMDLEREFNISFTTAEEDALDDADMTLGRLEQLVLEKRG